MAELCKMTLEIRKALALSLSLFFHPFLFSFSSNHWWRRLNLKLTHSTSTWKRYGIRNWTKVLNCCVSFRSPSNVHVLVSHTWVWATWEGKCSQPLWSKPCVVSFGTTLVSEQLWGFPCGSDGRVCLQCRRTEFDPWIGKIPWRREWQPTPVFPPEEFHGQRSLGSQRVGHDWETNIHTHWLVYQEQPWNHDAVV